MKRIVTTFLLLASLFICCDAARAEEKTQPQKWTLPAPDFSELVETGNGRVTDVINPLTIRLQDGRTLYLTGLDFPDLDFYDPGTLALTAQNIMKDMLAGQDIKIMQTKNTKTGRTNRMGYMLAHVVRKKDDVWVQGALLSLGLARVRTTNDNPEMATQMYTAESTARAESLGLWALDVYKIASPETAEQSIGTYQIVEGTIISASMKKNRLYLNFGGNWRTDFTASISASNRRKFRETGLEPQDWIGRSVRLRSWISSYNGPYMELTHPQCVEFIEVSDKTPTEDKPVEKTVDLSIKPKATTQSLLRSNHFDTQNVDKNTDADKNAKSATEKLKEEEEEKTGEKEQ